MLEQRSGNNKLDEGIEEFVARYKLELLSSFGLLALLGGIVLAVKLVDQRQSRVEIFMTPAAPTQFAKEQLTVEISGAVGSPGVYEVQPDSRINDLLQLAVGLEDGADRKWVAKNLNRAEVLEDGQKVYIPAVSEVEGGGQGDSTNRVRGTSTSAKVNLNTASKAQLEVLPGIGPTYAERIIQARPFKSVEQLLDISGIGPKKYELIKELVSVY